jgi:hypothetical protein
MLLALSIFVPDVRGQDRATTAPSPASASSSATTQPIFEAASKEADIHKLLVLTNAGQIGVQVVNQMIEQMRGGFPQVPNEFWDNFKRDTDPKQLEEMVVPIYSKHFSHDEIRQLIAFYESPLGRKVIGEMPGIMRESMDVGSQWGALLGQQIMDRLRDKGYLKA